MLDTAPAEEFFRRCLGEDWQEKATPVSITGLRATELLLPLNEVFRKHLSEIEGVAYDPRFESAADGAIDDLAATFDIGVLGQAPPGVIRVLLEQHTQMITAAVANEAAGNPIISLPSGLSEEQQRIGLALLFLRGMKLLWPSW